MPSDGRRCELVRGELRYITPAGNEQGRVAHRIGLLLGQHVDANRLGVIFAAETGFVVGTQPDTVRAPDAAFVSQQRIGRVGKVEGYWPEAPALAAEVISPGDRYTDVKEKTADWLAAGTQMVLIINPRNRSVAVDRSPGQVSILAPGDTLSGDDLVPGWRVAVDDIFR